MKATFYRQPKSGFINVLTLVLLLILVAAGLWFYNQKIKTVCQKTIYYDIGGFDSRFNISRSDFLKTATKSESVWEDPFHHNFFQYKPGAAFKINLVYDSRQETANQRARLDQSIDGQKSDFDALKTQYNQTLTSYNQALANYNAQVAKWNSQGGAPPNVYKQLTNQKAILDKQLDQLNALGDQLNSKSQEINNNVTQYNQSAGETFRQGEYTGNEINVYEFQNSKELELVLAHEMGHALGLDHVSDPKAIMNATLADQDLNNIKLSADDTNELDQVCRIGK